MIKIIASKTRDFQHTPTKATCSWVTSIVVRYRRQKDSDLAKWVNLKFKVLIINIKINKKILLIKTWKWVVFYKINKIKLTISNQKNPLISSMVIINNLKAKFKDWVKTLVGRKWTQSVRLNVVHFVASSNFSKACFFHTKQFNDYFIIIT
jgi:hypothetical protein